MASKPGDSENLKSLLASHLSGQPVKYRRLDVDALVGPQVQLTDNTSYFFLSKNLKKECAGVKSKSVTITLKKWKFVTGGAQKRGSAPTVDIETEDLAVVPSDADFVFSKSCRNLLESREIAKMLRSHAELASKAKGEKVKAASKAKRPIRATRKVALSAKKNEAKKKIAKAVKARPPNPRAHEVPSSRKHCQGTAAAQAQPRKKARAPVEAPKTQNHINGYDRHDSESIDTDARSEGLSNDYIFFDSNITTKELLEAPEYVPKKLEASMMKDLKLPAVKTAGEKKDPLAVQHLLSLKQRQQMAQIVSQVSKSSLFCRREGVDEALEESGLNVEDILVGVQNGKISWSEMVFPQKALSHIGVQLPKASKTPSK